MKGATICFFIFLFTLSFANATRRWENEMEMRVKLLEYEIKYLSTQCWPPMDTSREIAPYTGTFLQTMSRYINDNAVIVRLALLFIITCLTLKMCEKILKI
jgi:hypothetical protein